MNAEAAALFRENEFGEVLTIVAADGYGKPLAALDATYEKGEGITGMVWKTGETIRCDTHKSMKKHEWRKGKYDEVCVHVYNDISNYKLLYKE